MTKILTLIVNDQANLIVSAVTTPHTQLKNNTSSGVNSPSSNPAIPWWFTIGYTTNN